MEPKKGFTPEDGGFPFDGLDTTCPPVFLPPTSSPHTENLTTFQGTLFKRPGYSAITRVNLTGEPITRLYNFKRSDGVNILILWTATGVYSWDGDVSHACVNRLPEQTVVVLPFIDEFGNGWQFGDNPDTNTPYNGFEKGQYVLQETSGAFGIALSGAGIRVISGVFDNTHVISAVATSTRGGLDKTTPNGTTTADTEVTVGSLADSTNSYIDISEGVDTNLGRVVVFTNGIDPPMYWDGISDTFTFLPVNLEKFCTCKVLAVYNSYLVFANIQTTDDFEPRTAAWSDTGVFTEWQSGNAGILVETAVDGDILRLIPFTDVLAMFTTESIGCLCYINPDVIFGSRVYVTGINVVGPAAICKLNPYLVFTSLDNLYMWDGGRTITPIADKIALNWKTLRSTAQLKRTTLFYDPTESQLRFVVYITNSSIKQYILNMSLTSAVFYNSGKTDTARWFEYVFHDVPHAYSTFKDNATNITYVLFGGFNGFVYRHDSGALDNGVVASSVWDTGDLTMPAAFQSQFGRWLEVELDAVGVGCDVSYSLDAGVTWTFATTLTLTTTHAPYRVPIDLTSRTLRLRFSSTGAGFALSWFRVWFRAGGAR